MSYKIALLLFLLTVKIINQRLNHYYFQTIIHEKYKPPNYPNSLLLTLYFYLTLQHSFANACTENLRLHRSQS